MQTDGQLLMYLLARLNLIDLSGYVVITAAKEHTICNN